MTALAAAAVVAAVPVATQATPRTAQAKVQAAQPNGGWQRYAAQDFTAPAGTRCRFTLRGTVVFDREYIRTTRSFADGSPRVQQVVGPLVVRYTNQETGASVVRDLSARGVARYARDGSYDFLFQGPAGVGFGPGDSLRTGFYVLRGVHVVHFAADGTRTVTVDRGTEENICSVLRGR